MPLKAPCLQDSSLTIRIARNNEELAHANRLVCEKYISEGYWDNDRAFRRNPHMHSNMRTAFIVESKDKIIGTASVVKDSPKGLPLDDSHPSTLKRFRAAGDHLAEVSALALDASVTDQKKLILFLFKYIYQYSFYYGHVDRFVVATTARHAIFYKSVYCFEEIPGGDTYDYVKSHVKPTVLTLPLVEAHARFWERYDRGLVRTDESFYRFMLVDEHPNLEFPDKKLMQRNRSLNWLEQARLRQLPIAV